MGPFKKSQIDKMVSSPVADLLAPGFQDTYHEYKNAAGDTLSIRAFVRNGDKMVSVNGIELSMDDLLEIVQEAGAEAEDESEYDNEDNTIHNAFMIFGIMTIVAFLIIILYMRYVFTIAF